MKKILLYITVLLFIICLFVIENKFVYVYSNEETINNYTNEASLYVDKFTYEIGTDIDIVVNTNFSSEIESYSITNSGFVLKTDIIFHNNKINFTIIFDEFYENGYFTLNIVLISGENFCLNLYGIKIDNLIYVNPFSYFEAYNTYLYYLKNNDYCSYYRVKNFYETSNNINYYYRSNIQNIFGTLKWSNTADVNDRDRKIYPLRFNKVSLCKIYSDREEILETTYTDENGYFIFDYDINKLSCDTYIRVYASGTDVSVFTGYNELYYYDYLISEDNSKIFEMNISDGNYFPEALQVAQACIFSSMYYEEMIDSDSADVKVYYPHVEEQEGCFYNYSSNSIYITGSSKISSAYPESYESWDVIMHEYGHHVAHHENIDDSPGGWHSSSISMAEHYREHFDSSECTKNCAVNNNTVIFRNQCKYMGNSLSWSEGFATYYSMVSQEFFSEYLKLIYTTCDGKYISYNGSYISVKNFIGISEGNEATIASILYDMYDDEIEESVFCEDFDKVFLNHGEMWKYIINSGAKTFLEFNNYFKNNYTHSTQLSLYNEILCYHNLTTNLIENENEITTLSPNFLWENMKLSSSNYYSDFTYYLNFYNHAYSHIGSSLVTNQNNITIDEQLWTEVLNCGHYFYVTVSVVENNYPKTTYESEFMKYYLPTPTLIDFNIEYTRIISPNETLWFKFLAPQNGTYIFETISYIDTYGEIFNNIVADNFYLGLITENDNFDSNQNFKIVYEMNANQLIYLRVTSKNTTTFGEIIIKVTSNNHIHNYENNYTQYDVSSHKALCDCGEYILQNHNWYWDKTGYRCSKCYYYTNGPVLMQLLIIKKDEDEIS